MQILWRNALKQRSTRNYGHALAKRSSSNPGSAATRVAGIFHWPSFGFDFRNAGSAFYFHDVVAQKRRALELEIRRGFLHRVFQFAQQFSYMEIATDLLNNGGSDFSPAKNGVQTLLDG